MISLTHVDEAGEVSVLINATGELSGSDTVIVQSLLQYVRSIQLCILCVHEGLVLKSLYYSVDRTVIYCVVRVTWD